MTERNSLAHRYAESAVALAFTMRDCASVIRLVEEGDEDGSTREKVGDCQFSAETGRYAILAVTFLNPVVLYAASKIEGVSDDA